MNMVEQNSCIKIKTVCLDSGEEFLFLTQLDFVGLQHHITYSHMSQKNEIVEKIN